jgi:hypothetical protein
MKPSGRAIENHSYVTDGALDLEEPQPEATVTAESKVGESTDDASESASHDAAASDDSPKPQRRMTFSFTARGLMMGILIVVLATGLGTFAWLYVDARSKLDEQTRQVQDNAHAEKVALDYAVNAAAMNYQDLNSWKTKLVAGTNQELKDKLTNAATSMEQILVPLNWVSTAQPLVARVHSVSNGAYTVDCFVSVQTKTIQAPDPMQSTATYSVVVDSKDGWQITDVGGIGAVVGQR